MQNLHRQGQLVGGEMTYVKSVNVIHTKNAMSGPKKPMFPKSLLQPNIMECKNMFTGCSRLATPMTS